MRHVTRTPQTLATRVGSHRARRAPRRRSLASVALVWSMGVGFVTIACGPALAPDHPRAPSVRHEARADTPASVAASADDLALLDANAPLGPAPVTLAEGAPLPPRFEPRVPPAAPPQQMALADEALTLPAPEPISPLVEAVPIADEPVPLPPQRPSTLRELASPRTFPPASRQIAQARTTAPAAKGFDDRSFFEKFFGGLQQPAGPALGYAAPEDGLFGGPRRLTPDTTPSHDQYTAVYDIAAHTVILPNGTRLEAHSGLGDRLDDPRFVHERMRGPTPPHLYDLTRREQLFHGVQALRLNPVGGEGSIYGRTGLLAHTFMLGPNGDSNGCVSFRNYNAFLEAYQTGQVKRLMVVARQS